MSVCSVPGCTDVAVLQWTRAASETEVAGHNDRLNGKQAEMVALARASVELHIADLESMRDRLQAEGRLTPGAATVLAGQIESRQAALEGLVPAPDQSLPGEDVTVPVFGCAVHAVDAETATLVHPADCSTAGACACPVSS